MRKFGKIETGFWRNPKVRSLGEDAQRLLLYLLTCPHGNALGCFVLPMAYVADDLKWSVEKSKRTFSELLANGFVSRDEAVDLVLIKGWWGHNTVENPNVAKGIIAAVKALPKSELKQVAIKFLQLMADCPQSVSKLFAEQFRNPEPEPEPEIEPKPEKDARDETRALARQEIEREFNETFWPAFPVREGKKPALAAFAKARAKAPLETIMAGVGRYVQRLQQPNAPSPKWPQGWLNDERWNDEAPTKLFSNGHAKPPPERKPLGPAVGSPEWREMRRQAGAE